MPLTKHIRTSCKHYYASFTQLVGLADDDRDYKQAHSKTVTSCSCRFCFRTWMLTSGIWLSNRNKAIRDQGSICTPIADIDVLRGVGLLIGSLRTVDGII